MRIRNAGRTQTAAVAAAAVIAAACLAAPAEAPAAKPNSAKSKRQKRHLKPPPSYWGAWIGDQLTGEKPPWDMNAVSVFQSLIGKGLSLVALSSPFADCSQGPCSFFAFPTNEMEKVRAYGAIPFLNWASQSTSPDPAGATVMPDFQLADVIAGSYDGYITEFATAARNWGHPFFLRFNWEMNGNWFPWSESVNGNRRGEFVAAWRHVHHIFTAVGATNATWVWCPYADVKRNFQPLAQVYPGHRYVDWTCLDGFNWARNPANPHPWRTFDQIFTASYRKIVKRIAPGKPMILAEMASTGGSRAKAKWIKNMFKSLRTKFRGIRGLIWFNQFDRGVDWPLETKPAAARAFSKGIRNGGYAANRFAGVTASPIPPPG